MEVVYRCCCGIDVHKNLIVACLREGGGQLCCALMEIGFHNKNKPRRSSKPN